MSELRTATMGDLRELLSMLTGLHNELPLFTCDDWAEFRPYTIGDLKEALKIQWLCYPTSSCCWDVRTEKACKRIKEHCQGIVL
jgi:hypothetical protein